MPQRRNVPRYSFGGRGQLIHSSAPSAAEVTVVTISLTGCRIEGNKLPSAGETCALKFEWEGKGFEATGQVAWKTEDGSIGFRFDPIGDDSIKTLRELCANLRLELPADF